MLLLSISIRVEVPDEATAKTLNDKIVNEAKKIPNISVSSVTVNTLTKPVDLRA